MAGEDLDLHGADVLCKIESPRRFFMASLETKHLLIAFLSFEK